MSSQPNVKYIFDINRVLEKYTILLNWVKDEKHLNMPWFVYLSFVLMFLSLGSFLVLVVNTLHANNALISHYISLLVCSFVFVTSVAIFFPERIRWYSNLIKRFIVSIYLKKLNRLKFAATVRVWNDNGDVSFYLQRGERNMKGLANL